MTAALPPTLPLPVDPTVVYRRNRRVATALSVAAVVWGVGVAFALASVVTTGVYESVSSDASDRIVVEEERTTLLESEGRGVLMVLCAPAAVAVVALAAGWTRRGRVVRLVLGSLTWLLSMAGMLTVGFFLMPVAVGIMVAAAFTPGPHDLPRRAVP